MSPPADDKLKGAGKVVQGLGCCLTLTLTPLALAVIYLCWKAWEPNMGFWEFLLTYLK